jgi:hypothetical protein
MIHTCNMPETPWLRIDMLQRADAISGEATSVQVNALFVDLLRASSRQLVRPALPATPITS